MTRLALLSDVHGNPIALEAIRRVRHPAVAFIVRHQLGERHPPWTTA